jgi:hypothetical protein
LKQKGWRKRGLKKMVEEDGWRKWLKKMVGGKRLEKKG